ncbi:rhodanese-like domain-containing protein [Microbacterium sp. M1A1_1b]|uniref:rhodanese-like domain-containing protein n=1 Tax=Curtobacterium sp. VKM Ac-2922 TaxID=2929475 RepID=UPI001FB22629|nr:rhodanese-like domain-containing protein [Curtobacterium sp. VKM Ac-2922]MCJ1714855.1 rhodanese-like domain-containing protein [Curtobacterium sp. VKM Ac-2922]
MDQITTDQALARIAAGARLYDVREQHEWDEVHAPQATLVPTSEFAERWTEIESADQPAIVVCHSGMRSARVVQALEQQGVPAVNLSGGMVAWEAEGGPVVRPGAHDAAGERGHGH